MCMRMIFDYNLYFFFLYLYYFLLQTCKKLDLQVKPGLPYLDIISLLRDNSPLPIAAYQVLFFAHSSTRQNVSDKKLIRYSIHFNQ